MKKIFLLLLACTLCGCETMVEAMICTLLDTCDDTTITCKNVDTGAVSTVGTWPCHKRVDGRWVDPEKYNESLKNEPYYGPI